MSSLIAYDASGNILATLDYLVRPGPDGNNQLVDFEAHEMGGKLRELWNVHAAVGSATWPEVLEQAHEYRVELVGKQISALLHVQSGRRIERIRNG